METPGSRYREVPLPSALGGLEEALLGLQRAVAACSFDLATSTQAADRLLRDRLAAELGGHVARLRDLDAPLLVVVGGVTGAGKSTFLNTLLGREVLATGPLRPTTSAPTLLCHPGDAAWFSGDRVLPSLPRVEAAHHGSGADELLGRVGRGDAAQLRLLRGGSVPPGLALIDAPDVDSVSSANRDLADQLLDAADLWVWFTTAGKYADEDSMRYLRRARDRRTALAVVLAQVHHADAPEVVADFRAKLAADHFADVRLFVIPVTAVAGGRLPHLVGAELRDWLHGLAEPRARRGHRLQTLSGAVDAVPGDVDRLADGLAAQLRAARALLADCDHAYGSAHAEFGRALEEGLPLRGEVIARWDRFVGGGRVLKLTEAVTGQARTWIKGLLRDVGLGEERRLERQVRVEVADSITTTAGKLADLGASETAAAWSASPAGAQLLARDGPLSRRSQHFDERAEDAVRDWQQHVSRLVASVGASRRTQARIVSSVVSVAATSAILLAMAHAGITGAEAGIAAAAGAANQGLLVKLLGEANLRSLVADARGDLLRRFDDLMGVERRRFGDRLAAATPDQAQVDALLAARDRLVAARTAELPAGGDQRA